LRGERPKLPWTNNFFYRDRAPSRFHTAKTQSGRLAAATPAAVREPAHDPKLT
jgi:hypothetical protein